MEFRGQTIKGWTAVGRGETRDMSEKRERLKRGVEVTGSPDTSWSSGAGMAKCSAFLLPPRSVLGCGSPWSDISLQRGSLEKDW